ncbi:MAG: alpha/beta hydrolase [Gammaproteobacteria bacterium]|nr:alpha/beta hydrolase [Gammaproteobacteria bacterium]
MDNFSITSQSIICSDGYTLAATLFKPNNDIKAAILLGPATGIKRQFYASFASFLAQQGYGVLTFDNRGIGESLIGNVSDSQASLQCWGEIDMPGALDTLKEFFPATSYHLVGHSAGGQLIGLMPNADQFSSMCNIASSSGQLSNMAMPYWLKAQFFMNVFIPLSNMVFGHTKSQLLGMGQPLPKAVASQWRKWCNGQGYVKTAFGGSITTHYYDQLTLPSLWLNAIDDDIANNKNVVDMLNVFDQLPATVKTLIPQDHGLTEIGHMKFFSRKSQALWHQVTDWLALHS